jgi:hypothetical protein
VGKKNTVPSEDSEHGVICKPQDTNTAKGNTESGENE